MRANEHYAANLRGVNNAQLRAQSCPSNQNTGSDFTLEKDAGHIRAEFNATIPFCSYLSVNRRPYFVGKFLIQNLTA
jgi:hypothetical protein